MTAVLSTTYHIAYLVGACGAGPVAQNLIITCGNKERHDTEGTLRSEVHCEMAIGGPEPHDGGSLASLTDGELQTSVHIWMKRPTNYYLMP
jgi:hypothetical protein